MNKKAITILGAIFLLIVGTVGFLLYQRSKNKNAATPPPPPPAASQGNPPPTEIPPTEIPPTNFPPPTEEPPPSPQVSAAIKLTNGVEVISPVLFYQGNGVSYFNSQGQLFQVDLETATSISIANTRELTVPLKPGIKKILWPSAGNNYIIEYQIGGRTSWSVYVADRGEYVDLPSQVTSINWMPGGDKILYVWLDNAGKSTLNVANPDNTGYQVITDFWENDDAVSVSPDSKNILFFETNKTSSPNPINMVTADGKVFKSVVKDGFNKDVLWSPDSKKFVFFRASSGTDHFSAWVANLFSGEVKNLDITTTIDKVVWTADSQSVVAAVPRDASGEDMFFKINLASGDKSQFDPGPSIDARELFLTSTQDYVLFRNNQDSQLYALPIVGQ